MYLNAEGMFILDESEFAPKETILEFILIPGILKHTEYVELVISYEKGQCPYTKETFKEYIESQNPMLIEEYSRPLSDESIALFSKYLQETTIKCQS